ncbi:MAG: site-2 protease family protein [Planctomycetaceae bacterium]
MERDLLDRITWYIPLLLSLTVHEWAHAWTAWKLGDDTARMLGRVSLNPIVHIDPVGTLLLPLIGIPFGWARPVPINPVRFRHSVSMPLGVVLTAAAGPISNILIGMVCVLLVVSLPIIWPTAAAETLPAVIELLSFTTMINVLLALFNMIPIPPLDGSRIVESLVPQGWRSLWNQFCSLGPFLLVGILLLPFAGINLLERPMQWVVHLLNSVSAMHSAGH